MKLRAAVAVFALTCALTTGCDLLSKKDTTPTGPTGATTGIDAFAGTWSSVTASTPPAGCGNLKYTVTPTSASSANVSFTATCAGNITVTGSGAGTLSGSVINWSGSGLVSQGGVNCPFTFTNTTATLDAAGQIVVTNNTPVCGIPVVGPDA